MAPSKVQPIKKGLEEYCEKIIKIISPVSKWIFRYSGLEFIFKKFYPPKHLQPLPTGVIWLIGLYVAFFGVASQRYENRVDIIENRVNSIFTQLPTDVYKKALGRISTVQNMWCPEKPEILNPPSVFRSLFKEIKYQEIVKLLKETIEDWKNLLSDVNLYKASLVGANLDEASLSGANLEGANLKGAKLIDANLKGANLRGANLDGVNLEMAILDGAILDGASLKGASLLGANLDGVSLSGANLDRANLNGANLNGANLKGAKLTGARLTGANLKRANLERANLEEAHLYGANFDRANLNGANLKEAILEEAYLKGARGATPDIICEAKSLSKAQFDPELEKRIRDKCCSLFEGAQLTKENDS